MNSQNNFTERLTSLNNVCSAEKYTKRISVLLLPLVYFSAEQTLEQQNNNKNKGRCNYGVDIFQIQQPNYFFLEVKTRTKIAVKWDC